MGSLAKLPVELRLDIIELLKPYEFNAPAVGTNGCWTPLTTVVKLPGVHDAAVGFEPWNTAVLLQHQGRNEISALWNLRQTCKEMDLFCMPFLFQNINLIENDPEVASLDIPLRYGQFIRSIRVLIDPFVLPPKGDSRNAENTDQYQAAVSRILGGAPNLTSLALYYRIYKSSMITIANEIIDRMEKSPICSLGIHSIVVLHAEIGNWTWNNQSPKPVEDLFSALCRNPGLTSSIKHLDVTLNEINKDAYDLIRMHFESLESLSIRRGLRPFLGQIWDCNGCQKWYPKPNLTRLHLIDCLAAYAAHIPELVRLFTSLDYLTISTCGSWEDEVPAPRKRGWSTEASALCRARQPLNTLHIEHMADWEILALGIIPTRKLILSCISRGHFIRAIQCDNEIFPHLRTLSVVVPPTLAPHTVAEAVGQSTADEGDVQTLRLLKSICEQRNVEVHLDAFVINGGTGGYGIA